MHGGSRRAQRAVKINAACLAGYATSGLQAFEKLTHFWRELRSCNVYRLNVSPWARFNKFIAAWSLSRHARNNGAILDNSPLYDTLCQSMAALRPEGTLAVVGGTSGWGGQLDADALIDGALRLRGILVGSRAMAEDLVRFVERSGIRPLIDRRFSFEQAAAAYEYLGAARHVGKVIINVGPAA